MSDISDVPTADLWAELARRGEPCPDEDCPSGWHGDHTCASKYRVAPERMTG